MTAKHFRAIADAINAELRTATANDEHHGAAAIHTVARAIADNLAAVAPHFNRQRFIDACAKNT